MDNHFNVFISYSRKDSEQVLSVARKLRESGLAIWIDEEGIDSGDAFKSVIVSAIKNSDVIVFFSSKDSNKSTWVVKEVNTAVHLKKFIIPVRLDASDYNDSILFDLVGVDYVDMTNKDRVDTAFTKLLNVLLIRIKPASVEKMTSKSNTSQLSAEDCYQKGVECYESMRYSEAVTWFMDSAEKGNAGAQCYLGYMYENGLGVAMSNAEAAKWYLKAAEQGDKLAQNNLGSMYREGKGVEKNAEEAVRWFLMATIQGFGLAQYNLAIMYLMGTGVKQDLVEAVKWYREAAEHGLAEAQYSLGNMYRVGTGVPERDEAEAVKWFRKAAEQGLADAQHNLGYMYYYGCGVEKDVAEAVKWLRKAAEQGHGAAEAALNVITGS